MKKKTIIKSSEIKSTIARIARIDSSDLKENIRIREEVGIDSLMAMEILVTLEKEYMIKIDETAMSEVETIGEFIDFIKGLVSKRNHE